MYRRTIEVVSTIGNLTRRFLAIFTTDHVQLCNTARTRSSFLLHSSRHHRGKPEQIFEVCSERHPSTWYAVHLRSPGRPPSCQCWVFTSSNLPCKHFFAIFMNTPMSWADLTLKYRDSPYMTLDMDVTCQRPVSVAAVQPTHEDTDISVLQNNTTQQHSASEKINKEDCTVHIRNYGRYLNRWRMQASYVNTHKPCWK